MPLRRIGICGHRRIPVDRNALHASLTRIFQKWKNESAENWIFLSSLAEGADRMVLEVYAEWSGTLPKLEVYLPLPVDEYEKDFQSPESISEFRKWLEMACVHFPEFPMERPLAYLYAGQRLVDASSQMLFLWDGQPSRGPGGTADILNYTRKIQKPYDVVFLYE